MAPELVRIQLESGEALVATPEHPFAVPGGHWAPAGRLTPGARIVSARYGTLRVSSVRQGPGQAEPPASVFNLTVEGSHAYLAGRGQLLVHNTKCSNPQERIANLNDETEKAKRRLAALQETAPESPEVEDLKRLIARNKKKVIKIRYHQNLAGNPISGDGKLRSDLYVPGESAIARNIRRIEEAVREIRSVISAKKLATGAPLAELNERLAELRRIRDSAATSLANLRKKEQSAQLGREVRRLLQDEAQRELTKRELENERAVLRTLRQEAQGRETESPVRKAAKESAKRLEELQRDYDTWNEVVNLQKAIAKLDEPTPEPSRGPEQLWKERQQLRLQLSNLRKRLTRRRSYRNLRQHSKQHEQTPGHGSDAEQPWAGWPLEEELAAVQREPSSQERDNRIELLGERLQTLRRIEELNQQMRELRLQQSTARERHAELTQQGRDTGVVDGWLAAIEQKLEARRAEHAAAQTRATLLGALDEQRWWSDLLQMEVSESRLRELETEIAGSVQSELQPVAVGAAAHLQATPDQSVEAAAQSALRNLQQELNQERNAAEQEDFMLASEYASVLQTGGSQASTHDAQPAQRLESIRQQRSALSTRWRQRLQERLSETQRLLRDLQSHPSLRDETVEAELIAQIGLLEYEVNHPSF